MPTKVKLNNLRISARKVRLVANLIREKRAVEAQNVLEFTTKKASKPLKKLLDSAIASAKLKDPSINPEKLYVSEILVNEGRTLKRWRPRAQGRTSSILKRTSHIVLTLEELK